LLDCFQNEKVGCSWMGFLQKAGTLGIDIPDEKAAVDHNNEKFEFLIHSSSELQPPNTFTPHPTSSYFSLPFPSHSLPRL
jgi:hypothetical protein